MKTEHFHVTSTNEAWGLATEVFGVSCSIDQTATDIAGYKIFRGNTDAACWISDLGNRLELNMSDGSTINIWIDQKKYTAEEVRNMISDTRNELAAIENLTAAIKRCDISKSADILLETLHERKKDLTKILTDFGI